MFGQAQKTTVLETSIFPEFSKCPLSFLLLSGNPERSVMFVLSSEHRFFASLQQQPWLGEFPCFPLSPGSGAGQPRAKW